MNPKRSHDDPDEPSKRQKGEVYNKGALDPVFGQHSAFPVDRRYKRLEDIDIDDAATDVNAYLAMVRLEAEAGDQVLYVERETQYQAEGEGASNINDIVNAHSEDIELHYQWHIRFIRYFHQLKAQISDMEPVPADDLPDTFGGWRKYILSNEPRTEMILALDHELVMKLIIYVTKWINRDTNENLFKWVLSLFLRISKILDHTDCSTVRDLGKKAVKLKGTEVSVLAKYTNDVVISVVGDYFGQRDILDPYISAKI